MGRLTRREHEIGKVMRLSRTPATASDVQARLESIIRTFFNNMSHDTPMNAELCEFLQDEIDVALGLFATRGAGKR